MKIYISNYGSGSDVVFYPEEHGIEYTGRLRYKVLNKQLFMLTTIRYGLVYEEVEKYLKVPVEQMMLDIERKGCT
jgi:hypothetical protein